MDQIKPYRVLSLDGGGMRGTYTATYLEKVTSVFAQRRSVAALDIGAAFDLIVGTSTGAIIACALACGKSLRDVVTLYQMHGSKIFSMPVPDTRIKAITDIFRKRSNALSAGAKALQEELEAFLGTKTVKEIYDDRGIALAITAVNMANHQSWVFKTPHFERTTHRDDNYRLVDICLASSAAPIFRSMAAIDNPDAGGVGHKVFVDGGLWSNNPVLVGLIEALELASSGQSIEVYSLGTCPMPTGEQIQKGEIHRDLFDWKCGANVAMLGMDAQQFAYDRMARKIAKAWQSATGRSCSIVRFPSADVPAALIPYLGLDDTRDEAINALINQALTDADMTNSMCTYSNGESSDADLICKLFESAPVLEDLSVLNPEKETTAA